MNNIVIQCDTRNQIGKDEHVLEYFRNNGIKIVRSKLYVGDYGLLHDMRTIVDRKRDVMEIIQDICSPDHERFKRELISAQESSIKLYILIEDEYIYNIDGVKYYQIPRYKGNQYKDGKLIHKRGEKRSQVNLEALAKAMHTMEEKYGCTFCFAKHDDFGRKILELLGVEII